MIDFRSKLAPLGQSSIADLSKLSGVPFHTLLKIKSGETVNPGIETVRKFAPHLGKMQRAAA